ncbi:MAG: sporulation protein YqfD [Eubacteriales bacterium]
MTYEKDLAIYRAKTNDANLPATVYEETWTEYQVQQIQLTEEQALQKAKEELEKQQNEALKEDDKILSTNTTYTVENGQLILRATSVWEENIAQESENLRGIVVILVRISKNVVKCVTKSGICGIICDILSCNRSIIFNFKWCNSCAKVMECSNNVLILTVWNKQLLCLEALTRM